MKKIVISLFGIFVSMMMYAQEKNALVVKLNDGRTNIFLLSEKPVITMPDNNIVVTGTVSTTFARKDVQNLYFVESVVGQRGDVNNDGLVNISDIVAVINTIAKIKIYDNADVNEDGAINITDVTIIINIIAGTDSESNEGSESPRKSVGERQDKSGVKHSKTEGVMSNDDVTLFYEDGNDFHILGLNNKAQISMLSQDGRKIANYGCDERGLVSIPLSSQPNGLYKINYHDRCLMIRK